MRKRWMREIYIDSGTVGCDMCGMCGMHATQEAPLGMVRLGGALICEHCERALVSADPYAEGYDTVARLLRRAMFDMVIAGA